MATEVAQRAWIRRQWVNMLAILVGFSLVGAGALLMRLLIRHPINVYRVPGASMEPSICAGDRIVVRLGNDPSHPLQDGDIVGFKHDDTLLVKRIIAHAGETIEGVDGRLLLNGRPLHESYVSGNPSDVPEEEAVFPSRTIAPGEVFVAGDARAQSLDSRASEFGDVPVSDIIGRATYVYLSTKAGCKAHAL